MVAMERNGEKERKRKKNTFSRFGLSPHIFIYTQYDLLF